MLLPLALAVGCSHCGEAPAESALYQRYAALPETSVAQVCGFQLSDSVRVDVVLLQAESEAAWQSMKAAFAIDDSAGVTSWLASPEEPATRVKWDGQPLLRVIASHDRQAIGIYSLDDDQQYDALVDYQLNKMINEQQSHEN